MSTNLIISQKTIRDLVETTFFSYVGYGFGDLNEAIDDTFTYIKDTGYESYPELKGLNEQELETVEKAVSGKVADLGEKILPIFNGELDKMFSNLDNEIKKE